LIAPKQNTNLLRNFLHQAPRTSIHQLFDKCRTLQLGICQAYNVP
jgi:hypothetical protein